MKIYYNSRLAKWLTFLPDFATMMLFGVVITEHARLEGEALKHEETHIFQWRDCVGIGLAVAIAAMFLLFALDVRSWWMFLLAAIPPLLFYVIYGAEYLYWRLRGKSAEEAYERIGFERQARRIARTWYLPCEMQEHYATFGWWTKTQE